MKTAVMVLLVMVGAVGVSGLSLILLTRATLRLAAAVGGFLVVGAGGFWMTQHGPVELIYVSMALAMGCAVMFVNAMVRYGEAADARAAGRAQFARERDTVGAR